MLPSPFVVKSRLYPKLYCGHEIFGIEFAAGRQGGARSCKRAKDVELVVVRQTQTVMSMRVGRRLVDSFNERLDIVNYGGRAKERQS